MQFKNTVGCLCQIDADLMRYVKTTGTKEKTKSNVEENER